MKRDYNMIYYLPTEPCLYFPQSITFAFFYLYVCYELLDKNMLHGIILNCMSFCSV